MSAVAVAQGQLDRERLAEAALLLSWSRQLDVNAVSFPQYIAERRQQEGESE